MKRTTQILLWLGFAFIFLIPFFWYEKDALIIGGDLTFPLNPAPYFDSIFHIWRRVYTGHHTANSLTTLPFYAPMALFDALGFSLQTVQKLHFGLWLALPSIAMFYLSGTIFRDHPKKLIAQLAASSVYLFNTYQVVWADSARMAIWVGLPFMLGFFIHGLQAISRKESWLIWATGIALASMVISTAAINPPMFLMFLAIFVFWLLFDLATHPEHRTSSGLKQVGLFIATALLLTILVNLYWAVPYANFLINEYKNALTSGIEGINLANWLDPLSTHTSLLNVFRLQGAWDWYDGWAGEAYVPVAAVYQRNIFFLLWSIGIPIIAFAALLIRNKFIERKSMLFFAILSLLGLFFGAGSHEPTGTVYTWLVEHVPFLSIYRSPWYKFTTWTVLGYSILAAATIATLTMHFDKMIKNRKIVVALIGLFLVLNGVYAYGLTFGKVFPKKHERQKLPAAHVTFPDYFFSAADWVNSQSDDFRILQLPAQPTFHYQWGLSTLMDMTIFAFNKPTIWWPEQIGAGKAKAGSEEVAKTAFEELYIGRSERASRLLGLLNVKYILQKNDIDYRLYNAKDTPEFIKSKLTNAFFSLRQTIGQWDFYEISKEHQQPLFFATNTYVETLPALKGVVRAIDSHYYNKNITFSDYTGTNSQQILKSGYYITPDTTKARVHNGRYRIPITVPAAGDYSFEFKAGEAVDIFVNEKPLTYTVKDDIAKTEKTKLAAGEHQLDIEPRGSESNLIQNPSFEEGIWEKPIDATEHRQGRASFTGEVVSDGTDGSRAVRLTTQSHAAAIRKGIDNFETDRSYIISFDYKYGYGNPPSYALWQDGALLPNPAGDLEKNKDWTSFSALLTPSILSTGGHLFLYADDGEASIPTQSYYDNVKIVKVPAMVESLVIAAFDENVTPIPSVSYKRLAPTAYQVTVKGATQPFLLNFLETYDSGWEAQIERKTLPSANHLRAFTYANAWVIDKQGDYTIDIIFKPQRTFMLAGAVTLLGLAICFGLIWYSRKQRAQGGQK